MQLTDDNYMSETTRYAVFGAGSWATAIVKMLCENLDEVSWYMRSTYIKDHLNLLIF